MEMVVYLASFKVNCVLYFEDKHCGTTSQHNITAIPQELPTFRCSIDRWNWNMGQFCLIDRQDNGDILITKR